MDWDWAKLKSDGTFVRAFKIVALDVWPPGVNVANTDKIAILHFPAGDIQAVADDWLVMAMDNDAVQYVAASDFDARFQLSPPPPPPEYRGSLQPSGTDSPLKIL